MDVVIKLCMHKKYNKNDFKSYYLNKKVRIKTKLKRLRRKRNILFQRYC